MYDASGRLGKTFNDFASSSIKLNVSNFEKGVYLVLVKTDSGNKALKLIKK